MVDTEQKSTTEKSNLPINDLRGNLSLEQVNVILHNRAMDLAKEPEDGKTQEESLQVLAFSLGEERYAVQIKHVEEVRPLGELTPISCAPKFVLGVVNLRGNILSVIDIRSFFNLASVKIDHSNKIIVINACELRVGILVDCVHQIQKIPLSKITPPVATFSSEDQKYIKGVTTEMLIILDILTLLEDKRIIVQEEVG